MTAHRELTPREQIRKAEAYKAILWQLGGESTAQHKFADAIIEQARSQMVEGPL